MYSIKCNIKDKTKIGNVPVDEDGNFIIYDDIYPTNGAKALSPKLSLKDNGPGQLDFKLPPGNVGYDLLERMSSEIIVSRNGEEIWAGRIISEEDDFQNNKTFTCEGALAYLSDTTQEPKVYENYTISDFLDRVLAVHSSKVTRDKNRIYLGNFESSLASETYTFKTNDNTTLEAISDQVINRFGGHIVIRIAKSQIFGFVKYLDYYQDYHSEHSQVINFGYNLLDFTRNWEVVDFVNVVTPRANVEADDETGLDSCIYATVANGGSRYITNESSISDIGWLESIIDLEETDLDSLLQMDDTFQKLCNIAGPIENSLEPTIPGYGTKLFDEDESENVWSLKSNYQLYFETDKKKIRDYIGDRNVPESNKPICRLLLGLIILIDYINNHGTADAITEVDEDVIPALLKIAGENYLNDQQFNNVIIDINAVDLNYLGVTSDSIGLLDTVKCVSRPHNFEKELPVTELSIQLDKPDSSTYTLSGTFNNGDFDVAASSISAPTASGSISEQYNDIIRNEKKAFRDATRLINSATRGHVTIQRSIKGTESIAIAENLSYDPKTDLWDEGTKLWKWNLNGLGYSTDGGRNYSGVAITMDGTINADFLRVGVIKGGFDNSKGTWNSEWDLGSGFFKMERGSINLGKDPNQENVYNFSVNDDGEINAISGHIGGFTIDDDSIYNDTITMNENGIVFSKNNTDVCGYISNEWVYEMNGEKIYTNYLGACVALDTTGSFISWGRRTRNVNEYYEAKLLYTTTRLPANDGGEFNSNTLYTFCTLDGNTNKIRNYEANYFWIEPNRGGCIDGVNQDYVIIPVGITEDGRINAYIRCYIENGFLVDFAYKCPDCYPEVVYLEYNSKTNLYECPECGYSKRSNIIWG